VIVIKHQRHARNRRVTWCHQSGAVFSGRSSRPAGWHWIAPIAGLLFGSLSTAASPSQSVEVALQGSRLSIPC